MGIIFDTHYFDDYAIAHFVTNYLEPAGVLDLTGKTIHGHKTLEAGKAIVVFK